MGSGPVVVCVEAGARRVFASALAWPGWCRSGKTEAAAVEALADYAPRYAVVARRAGHDFALRPSLEIVERLTGDATTDFGAPGVVAEAERQPVTGAQGRRLAGLATAAWAIFDEITDTTPAQLRKGPRGGGRDRDPMVEHVLGAEAAYARKIGIKLKPPTIDDVTGIETLRVEIAAVLAAANDGSPIVDRGWPTRYAARRIAWHVLDHAWEMQDRAEPVG